MILVRRAAPVDKTSRQALPRETGCHRSKYQRRIITGEWNTGKSNTSENVFK
jgi:hypothetical protein